MRVGSGRDCSSESVFVLPHFNLTRGTLTNLGRPGVARIPSTLWPARKSAPARLRPAADVNPIALQPTTEEAAAVDEAQPPEIAGFGWSRRCVLPSNATVRLSLPADPTSQRRSLAQRTRFLIIR